MSEQDFWVNIFADSFSDLKPSRVLTTDLFKDKNFRLVALHSCQTPCINQSNAASAKSLRIFSRGNLEKEVPIKSSMTEIANLGNGIISIAGGPELILLKELKPYFRFELRKREVDSGVLPGDQEGDVWAGIKRGDISAEDGLTLLSELRDINQLFSPVSVAILSSENKEKLIASHVEQFDPGSKRFLELDCITCLSVIKRGVSGLDNLIIGTESGCVVLVDSSGTKEHLRFESKKPVQFLSALDQDRIACCSRDGLIASFSLGPGEGKIQELIQLDSPCSGMTTVGSRLYLACMTRWVHCYTFEGVEEFCYETEDSIQTISHMHIPNSSLSLLLVLLQRGEIVVYSRDRKICSVFASCKISTFVFGRYGKEDCALTLATTDGRMITKALKKKIVLDSLPANRCRSDSMKSALSDALRSRSSTEDGIVISNDMHIPFQQNLQLLKLETLKAYRKVLMDGEGAFALNNILNLQFKAEINGLGPRFQVKLDVMNTGNDVQTDLSFRLLADIYSCSIAKKFHKLPWICPGKAYTCRIDILCTEEGEQNSSDIVLILMKNGLKNAVLTAKIKIPISISAQQEP